MGVSAERGRPALFTVRSCDTAAESGLTHDFRISDAHHVGEGSLREKAFANLAAIRTLKQVEADQRPATEEEKVLLVRYNGWGAMPQAFSDHAYSAWNEIEDALKALLTEEEYNSARASLPNAHCTARLVVRAIWSALELTCWYGPGPVNHRAGSIPSRHLNTADPSFTWPLCAARFGRFTEESIIKPQAPKSRS
jgi:hypothetical protein